MTFARSILPAGLIAVLAATPALAHHPLGGLPMTTFGDGLLSGVGHPVLGFDHLLFVVAIGIAALFTARPLMAPLAYVVAMVAGVGLAAMGMGLPLAETMIIISLLALGGWLAMGRNVSMALAVPAFAFFGLFHGTAFGGALAEQESVSAAVLIGYLIGLAGIQWLVAIAAGYVVQTFWRATEAGAMAARLSGAAIAGAGILLSLEAIEGAAFTLLGIG
jgi:urease accessory protein